MKQHKFGDTAATILSSPQLLQRHVLKVQGEGTKYCPSLSGFQGVAGIVKIG